MNFDWLAQQHSKCLPSIKYGEMLSGPLRYGFLASLILLGSCGPSPEGRIASQCQARLAAITVGNSVKMADVCPEAKQVCILREYLSLDIYESEHIVSLSDKQKNGCSLNSRNQEGAVNEIIGISPNLCPFFINDTARVYDKKGPFSGNCVDPLKTSISRRADGAILIREEN
jgi:hypothetical protein